LLVAVTSDILFHAAAPPGVDLGDPILPQIGAAALSYYQ
jgi:hypothetical protein